MNSSNMNHHHLVNNIQESQKQEQNLYLDLEKLPSNNAGSEIQKEIAEKINNTVNARIALFKQLHIVYDLIDDNVTNEKIQLKDQMHILEMMDKHLQQSRKTLMQNKNLNVSNLRMTEINTYYSDKYRAQYAIVRLIVILCLPLLILAILRNRNIIPTNLSGLLATLVFIIGFFLIIPRIIDIYSRNNMVFSQYDFPFDPTQDSTSNQDGESDLLKKWGKDLKLLEEGECIGPACCGKGMVYDNKKEVCIIENSKKRESFLAGQSTQLVGADLSKQLISTDKSGEYYSL